MEQNRPLVSVIIPCFNHQNFIGSAIESVMEQGYSHLELVVIDDDSTDESWKIIQSYKDSRIKAFKNQKNLGISRTINNCLNKTTGEYIALLGSDDLCLPNRIAQQMELLQKRKALIAFAQARIIDRNNQENDQYNPFRVDQDWLEQPISFEQLLFGGNFICSSTGIMHRKVIEDIGIYNPLFHQLQDYDYWLRAALKYEIWLEPIVTTLYRYDRLLGHTSQPSLSANNRINLETLSILDNVFSKNQNLILEKLKLENKKEFYLKMMRNGNLPAHQIWARFKLMNELPEFGSDKDIDEALLILRNNINLENHPYYIVNKSEFKYIAPILDFKINTVSKMRASVKDYAAKIFPKRNEVDNP